MKYKEITSIFLKNLNDIYKNLQDILLNYSFNNIFNVDKTRFYWKIKLNHILLTGSNKKLIC